MKFHIKKDHKGEWRWTLKAANGEPIAVSSEGYSSKQACKHGLELVKGTTNIPIVEDD